MIHIFGQIITDYLMFAFPLCDFFSVIRNVKLNGTIYHWYMWPWCFLFLLPGILYSNF